jgi:hypothetical protein
LRGRFGLVSLCGDDSAAPKISELLATKIRAGAASSRTSVASTISRRVRSGCSNESGTYVGAARW